MNDDIDFSKSSILVSFVAGGLTGAAVALLLAPLSGRRTRRLVNQRIRNGAERGRKASDRIARKGRAVLDGASNYIGEHQKDLEQRLERLVSAKTGP